MSRLKTALTELETNVRADLRGLPAVNVVLP